MRIQTQGNSNNVWLSSDEGVINNTMILTAPTLEKILQAVNEKYGTSLEGWSQLPTAYEVGDTVPNWNAYEKITLQTVKIKFQDGKFGEVKGNKLYIATSNGKNVIIVNMLTGLVATLNGTELTEQMKTNYTAAMRYYGYEVSETTSETLSLEVGDQIEGWNEYILIQ